jgi:hypothetical protein
VNIPGNGIPDIVYKATAFINVLTDKAAYKATNNYKHYTPKAKEQYAHSNQNATCYPQKGPWTSYTLTAKSVGQSLLQTDLVIHSDTSITSVVFS